MFGMILSAVAADAVASSVAAGALTSVVVYSIGKGTSV